MKVIIRSNGSHLREEELSALILEHQGEKPTRNGFSCVITPTGEITEFKWERKDPYNVHGYFVLEEADHLRYLRKHLLGKITDVSIDPRFGNCIQLHYGDRIIQVEGISFQSQGHLKLSQGEEVIYDCGE